MTIAIKIDNLSKQYRLGLVSTRTLSHDLNRWYQTTIRGKEDPYLKIGEIARSEERGVESNPGNENETEVEGKSQITNQKSLITNHLVRSLPQSDYIWALKDINLEVQQGEVLGIIGKNGAGKSTLLKILSKVTAPTTGTIKAKGRIASLLEVGTGFHPEMTGRENIFMNGAIMGMSKAEITRKLDEIIDFAGVEQFIDTPVKRYSSGMTVRLGFAVAAHLEPEILVVDEVLAVGDAEFQKKAIGKIQDISKGQGRTVLFVSHNMEAIVALTNRTVLLKDGNIVLQGKTGDIVREYINFSKSNDIVYLSNKDDSTAHIRSVRLVTSYSNNFQLNGDTICVIAEIFNPISIKGACFSFQFVDSTERNFAHLWTFDSDIPFCRESGNYQLKCTINNLKLYMGQYYLKCYFSEPPGGRVFEIIENICPFEVVMHKTTRSNFQWYPEACAYIEDGNWEIIKK